MDDLDSNDWPISEFRPRLPDFQHQTLDRDNPSIRLLRVLPNLNKDGYTQCQIANEKVDAASYMCLSYTWGKHNPSRWIVLNDKRALVRLNLWSFLDVARAKYPLQWIWIDALCIDQSNIKERNHQVGQMGKIYSMANNVVVWLGDNADLAALFRTAAHSFPADVDFHRILASPALGWQVLVRHKYWGRAWITQEIALSKKCSLLASDTELNVSKLTQLCEYAVLLGNQMSTKSRRYLEHIRGDRLIQKGSLIDLLNSFPEQGCSIARDRMYSLLSLATEGSHIHVDYGASTKDFLFGIVRACAPSMCLCSFVLIAEVVGNWNTYQHEEASHPIPIAQIMLRRAQTSDNTFPVIFETSIICDEFKGQIYMAEDSQDYVIASKRWGVKSAWGSPTQETQFENGVFAADGSGMSLRQSGVDSKTWILRIGVPTLLNGPLFERRSVAEKLCRRALHARGPFSFGE